MSDLPAGWTEVALGEVVVEARPGFASGDDLDQGLFQFRMNNLDREGRFDFSKKRRVTFDPDKTERFLLHPGDVLFNATNSPEMVGKSAFFNGHEEPAVFSNHFLRLRPGPALDGRYLARWLQLLFRRGVFAAGCRKWVNQATYGKDSLLGLRIPLPPLEEQRRIAAILDKADELRAQRRAALEQLEALIQAIFLDMFGDPVANSRRWPVVQIGDVTASATYGTSQRASGEGAVPVLRMGNLTTTGAIDTTDLKFLDRADEKHLLRPGDVLFNRTNSADLVGKTAVFRLPGEWAYAGYLVRLRLTEEAAPDYVGTFMNLPTTKQRLRSMCKAIVGQANINAKELQRIPMPLPPRGLQDDFAHRLDAVERAKDRASAGESSFDVLCASLRARAFRGEL